MLFSFQLEPFNWMKMKLIASTFLSATTIVKQEIAATSFLFALFFQEIVYLNSVFNFLFGPNRFPVATSIDKMAISQNWFHVNKTSHFIDDFEIHERLRLRILTWKINSNLRILPAVACRTVLRHQTFISSFNFFVFFCISHY